jgi:putative tryptophan/tyrosine transport system substrate-binding protein
MRRRDLITLLGGTLTGAALSSLVARAQQTERLPRIGYLSDESEAPTNPFNSRHSVLKALRGLGYADGKNIVIEYRYAAGKVSRLPALAAELSAMPVDVIFSVGTVASKAAVAATSTIPIVFARVGDPVGSGLVASLARPGANATGMSLLMTDLAEKRLELLKQAVPGISRIALLHEVGFLPGDLEFTLLKTAAGQLNLEMDAVGVRPPDGAAVENALAEIMKGSPQALYVGSSGWFEDVYEHTLNLAFKTRLPALYVRREYVEAGGFMSYGVNYPEMYQLAAAYIVRILKGAKPADLPVQEPVKIELLINLETAKALGIRVPLDLQVAADEVIE